MKSKKYGYLNKYIHCRKDRPYDNWFGSIAQDTVKVAEQRLGFEFPVSLKEFWEEIGFGVFRSSLSGHKTMDHTNRIMGPSSIADIILLKEESGLILPEVPMVQDAIPFFEIGDCYDFLVMLPKSDRPEAIYDQYGYFVEKDLEAFIHRLYYESPTYYLEEMKKAVTK